MKPTGCLEVAAFLTELRRHRSLRGASSGHPQVSPQQHLELGDPSPLTGHPAQPGPKVLSQENSGDTEAALATVFLLLFLAFGLLFPVSTCIRVPGQLLEMDCSRPS